MRRASMPQIRAAGQKLLTLVTEWCYREDESDEERFRKHLLVPIIFSAIGGCILNLCLSALGARIHGAVALLVHVAQVIYLRVTRTLSPRFAEFVILSAGLGYAFIQDFRTFGQGTMWSLCVPTMDLLLLCGSREWVVKGTWEFFLVYMTFLSLEETFHFGVFDAMPDEMTVNEKPKAECALGFWAGFGTLWARLFVFTADFVMTKYFCKQMRAEQDRIKTSVVVAQEVTEALVKFDLGRAQQALESGSLTDELHRVFSQLLENLESYRPYLPASLFDDLNSPLGEGSGFWRAPPQGEVAMVFTDIKSSSAIWEASPDAMRKGMITHNRILRKALQVCNGYEVKTIGDSFMVAFDTALDACRFCLAAQEGLYDAKEWCDELQQSPDGEAQEGVWKGLRVRMGVHIGEMVMQINPVTERADYFGSNVNIASRVEGVALPGTVAVTKEVMAALGNEGIAEIGNPIVLQKGEMPLKGISWHADITLLCPQRFPQRLNANHNTAAGVNATADCSAPSDVSAQSSAKRLANLGGGMDRSRGTVCVLKVNFAFLERYQGAEYYHVNTIITTALDAVTRTNGVLLGVTSSSVVSAWNMGKSVYNHPTQAALAASIMYSAGGRDIVRSNSVVGIATGPIVHGRVGSDSQRFVVAVGPCVDLAESLASSASSLQAFALVSAVPGDTCIADDPTGHLITRRVERWVNIPGAGPVYQLQVSVVQLWSKGELDEDAKEWMWSKDFTEHLEHPEALPPLLPNPSEAPPAI